MLRKLLIVFVISVFLFSALALTEAYAFRGSEHSAAGIEVYDAEGQYLGVLGSYLGNWRTIHVYVPSLSGFVTIENDTGESAKITLNFQSNNCTGTPYIRAEYVNAIRKFGEKYYTGAKTVPVKIEMYSALAKEGCRILVYPYPHPVVPAEEVSADLLPFTLPVALPLEFKYGDKKWDKRNK